VNERWLAIDSTTDVMSVAVGTWERGGGSHSAGARQHAAQIIPTVKRVLGDTRLQDLAGIVVGDGPGSFTGLRIAWAAARGLAHQLQLPILAVPTLHAVAYAHTVGKPGPALVCIDALRGQVFAAIYDFPKGRLETLVPPGLFTIPELVRAGPAVPARAFLDGGAGRYASEIEKWIGRAPVGAESFHSAAEGLLALAPLVGYAASGEPLYGRSAEAQVKWEARYGRPLPHSSR
jgi:tRNA threonylcarbamoyl adenosine modification protein YeaZ